MTQNPCLVCGQLCPPPAGAGRPRLYCSAACRRRGNSKPNGSHKRQDIACRTCGRPMWRSGTSLPQGKATCLPCRRAAAAQREAEKPKPVLGVRECAICGQTFEQRQAKQVYCSAKCRESRRNWTYAKKVSASARGYGAAHAKERRRWKPIVERGEATCCICGYAIDPGTSWHLDHTEDRTGYRGVAHAECNIRDGARRGARVSNRTRRRGAPLF